MSFVEIPENEEEAQPEENHFVASTPYNTFVLLACIVLVFGAEQLLPLEAVVDYLGFVKPAFLAGEWWRVLTSSVVHAGIAHVGFNGFALFMLGRLTEVLSSKANVPILFVLAAIAGAAFSLFFTPNVASVGASGGVIGILGYLTIYSFRRRKIISSRLFKDLLFNIGIITVFGVFIMPNVDNWAHLGGFVAGFLYGLFEVPNDLYVDPRKTSRPKSIIAAVCLGAVILTSLFSAGLLVVLYAIG